MEVPGAARRDPGLKRRPTLSEAEVSIVFSSRGAPKTLTSRAHFLVLPLLLRPRLVFRESYTQECGAIGTGADRRGVTSLGS